MAEEFDNWLDELEKDGSNDIVFADFDDDAPIRDYGRLPFSFTLKSANSPYCNYILKGYIDYGGSNPDERIANFVNDTVRNVVFDPVFPHINLHKNGSFCFGGTSATFEGCNPVAALETI